MKVLVPLDESDVSLSILPALKRLSTGNPATEFHFMTVKAPDDAKVARMGAITGSARDIARNDMPSVVETRGQAISRVEEEEGLWLKQMQQREMPGANATFHVDWGEDVHDVICDRANAIDADIIAMATHGRKGLKRALTGGVTEKVIRESGRPVLVVNPPDDD